MDHVAAKCPSGRYPVGKRRDETTGAVSVTSGHMRVPISKTMEGVSVRAEQLKYIAVCIWTLQVYSVGACEDEVAVLC